MQDQSSLRDGRLFHELIARYFLYEDDFVAERSLVKSSDRRGRADLFLWVEPDRSHALIAETKWTDWECLERRGSIRRNVARHRRQIWSYLDGRVFLGTGLKGDSMELRTVTLQGVLVYPAAPRSAATRQAIEAEMGEWGIVPHWFDEPPMTGTPGGKAWAALTSGEIPSQDLRRSKRWRNWIRRIRRTPALQQM